MRKPRSTDYKAAEAAVVIKARNKLPPPDGLDIITRLRQRRTYMSVPEYAVMIDEVPRSVYRQVREGRLPHLRIGYSVKLDPQEMADFLEARRVRIAPVGAAARVRRSRAQAGNSESEQQTRAATEQQVAP